MPIENLATEILPFVILPVVYPRRECPTFEQIILKGLCLVNAGYRLLPTDEISLTAIAAVC